MFSFWREIADPVKTILAAFWKTSRWLFVFTIVIIILSSLASVSAPYLFSRLIDQLQSDFQLNQLLLAFILYAILLGSAAALKNLVEYISLVISQNLSFAASTLFFEKLIKKTTEFFTDNNPAQIHSAQQSGTQALLAATQILIIALIPGGTQVLFTLLVLGAAINAEIVIIVALYGIFFIGATIFVSKWTSGFLDTAIVASQENAKFVGNSFNSIETLRQFNADNWIKTKFATKAEKVRDNWNKYAYYRIGFAVVFGMALAIQFAITFTLLIPRYQSGEISLGDVVLFNILLLQLNQPFEMIAETIDEIVRSYSRFLPFASMWAAPAEIEPENGNSFTLGAGIIEFINVGFSYKNKRGISEISFSSKPSQITFITGETGVGKSTLFKLALKSLNPETGKILVDGVDLDEISRTDWFSNIGVVPQDIMLLNDTIKSNIILGRSFNEAQMRRAAKKAAILDFIDQLPDGFETKVGERGLKLSGGERQRIAISRALYADPKILFLDEASAALDDATQADIMANLRHLSKNITIIAITHRSSFIGKSDNVIGLS
ncbi:MAG: ABC transporter ATP-binding protein/permease [Devosiaceae bacterium]|nr:ABC transporter ATP-binding protein/permease [Devosiaceae bacterium]